jgi:hypothetical protein
LQKGFKEVDKDKSGDLDFAEFKALMKKELKTEMTDDTLQALFSAFDKDGSGKVDFKELATGLSLVSKGTTVEKLTILFNSYDRDGSGELDKDEVNAIFAQMKVVAKGLGRDPEKAEDFSKAVLAKLDQDGSGQISLAEWLAVGQKTPSLLTLLGAS